jgi:N-glycosylase/DNA lyase
MTQTAAVLTKAATVHLELPAADIELMPGVRWGAFEAFPTPAYWFYQVFANRVRGAPLEYKLGRTLAEEIGACLLGGHGISASVGLAAYEHLRSQGTFAGKPSETQLVTWLQQPLLVNGRSVRYRFAAQKARYLAAALKRVHEAPATTSGKTLRDWLLQVPGIGYKTASWIARNWLRADDVAILDIHIVRFGRAIGLFPPQLTVERHYTELERLFLEFSRRVDVRPSELDAVIWFEMASSPRSVRQLVAPEPTKAGRFRLHASDKGHTNPVQLTLAA